MDKYYTLNNKNKKQSRLKWLFTKKSVKPVFVKQNNKNIAYEFYKKYGIIYTGSIEGSCIYSLF